MTTDTRPKDLALTVRLGRTDVVIRGIAKGSGMIHPNMATMLAFIAADASIRAPALRRLVSAGVKDTFNMITVDGDTSTSDMVAVMANGAAGGAPIQANSAEEKKFGAALLDLMRGLAVELARDGEGATKLIEVRVAGARNEADARAAARAVTTSNLVKTAVFGCDANWGRLAAALGNSSAQFDPENVAIKILGVTVMRRGLPVAYDEPTLQSEMKRLDRVVFEVHLGAGQAKAVAWGSDLGYDYIKINADYRT
jgi:glutamate N-acetyltransferase/amino-acid N-acetyltransferase